MWNRGSLHHHRNADSFPLRGGSMFHIQSFGLTWDLKPGTWNILVPFLIPILIIPSDGCPRLCHALLQTNGVDDLGSRLASFIPRGGKRMIFSRMDRVLQAEFNRVKAHRPGDL